ncbi:uncharacterized protein LACBIDRAFT_310478 [Laccaria bicolor S238N-H82]|uniref:Predicted protein n=1 Tax=Laccaria bicolor (strain S238N-H82 / ATCC MYA-4686) TaxID=486041 RepID=B0DUF3_LACBS|nr:uncharacterized protein LACBIDRAFT_310478 [Laccaria bicolor S238N-H82]EDR01794.1 predicted protein [Laccaria bicolor S238N-H82]|eukprot:XP_001887607.1 predicted protein [Laccaria bicolor S238N-H82]
MAQTYLTSVTGYLGSQFQEKNLVFLLQFSHHFNVVHMYMFKFTAQTMLER